MAKNSERAHNRAKHNAGTWSRPKEMSAADDDAQAAWREDYYRNARPDIDPQSTTSRVLEFFGLDNNPYALNDQSFDYRQKAWDDSLKSGNPDLSWSLPLTGSFKFWGDEVDGRIPTQAEASAAIEDATGRAASSHDELENVRYGMADPRSRDEKNAAAALSALDFPLVGFGDEAVAGTMSALGRDTYDNELERARAIQERAEEYGDLSKPRSIVGLAGGLIGSAAPAGALWRGTEAATAGLRGLVGASAAPATRLGRGAKAAVDAGAAGGTDFGLWNFGRAHGDASERAGAVDPGTVAGGAALGLIGGPVASALGGGLRAAGRGAKSAGQKVLRGMRGASREAESRLPQGPKKPAEKPNPKMRQVPQEPGDVRGDIEAAFRRRRRK